MQENRWSSEELQLIKDVFKNEELVYEIRDVMMGFKDTFNLATSSGVIKILRKNLLPTFLPGIPLEKQQDLCKLSLQHIMGFNTEEGIKRIDAFDLAIDYLQRRFAIIERGAKDEGLKLEDFKKPGENRFVRMLAYLTLADYIEKSIHQLYAIATYTEKTPEQLQEMQRANSTK